jgi:SAM-dependent methyltransferase
MTSRYADVLEDLRTSYDAHAAAREAMTKQQFKLDERAAFADRLRVAEARTLLEVGAGTGQDSLWFQQEGLDVTAVDLSPEMVEWCRAKGLRAYVRDLLNLGFEADRFDAVYTVNCLLHVPNADLPAVLAAIAAVLKPGGLGYIGVWGGRSHEGPLPSDQHVPPRFFALRSDRELFDHVAAVFDVIDFHTVEDHDLHFQALTVVKPEPTPATGRSW